MYRNASSNNSASAEFKDVKMEMINKFKCSVCEKLPITIYRNGVEIFCQDCNKDGVMDLLLQDFINEIEIDCKNALCNIKIKVKDFEKHLSICDFEMIECDNIKFGCKYNSIRSEYNHDCKYDIYKYVETKFEKLYSIIEEQNKKIEELENAFSYHQNIIENQNGFNYNYRLEKIETFLTDYCNTRSEQQLPINFQVRFGNHKKLGIFGYSGINNNNKDILLNNIFKYDNNVELLGDREGFININKNIFENIIKSKKKFTFINCEFNDEILSDEIIEIIKTNKIELFFDNNCKLSEKIKTILSTIPSVKF